MKDRLPTLSARESKRVGACQRSHGRCLRLRLRHDAGALLGVRAVVARAWRHERWREEARGTTHVTHVCGFAEVVLIQQQSDLKKALVKLRVAVRRY